MGRVVAGIALVVVALAVLGAIAVNVLQALTGLIWYLLVGALVVGGGVYLYRRMRRAVGPGTRARRRLDAARRTYEIRNR